MRNHRYRSIPVIHVIIPAVLLSTCRSLPEPEPQPEEPPPAPIQTARPAEEPSAFLTDWAGTTWIVRSNTTPKTFPGYRGFHLGHDGRLLLINMDEALGDRWTAEGNELRLTLISGRPQLPLEGVFLAFTAESGDSDSPRMRLVPSSDAASAGIIFERAAPAVDIVENHWIPKRLDGGDTVMWPMNREIHLILLPDGTGGLGILGYGGENRFRGPVIIDKQTFRTGPIAKKLAVGPNSDFEDLFVGRIGESTRSVQVDHDLFLFRQTRPTAAFRVQLFD